MKPLDGVFFDLGLVGEKPAKGFGVGIILFLEMGLNIFVVYVVWLDWGLGVRDEFGSRSLS